MSTAFPRAEVGNIQDKERILNFCPTYGLASYGFPTCHQSIKPQRKRKTIVKLDAGIHTTGFTAVPNSSAHYGASGLQNAALQITIQSPRSC